MRRIGLQGGPDLAELLGEEMDGFSGITHGLCVRGKEWVAAFSGPQACPTHLSYSRIDLRPLSHGGRFKERNTKSSVSVKNVIYALPEHCAYGSNQCLAMYACACLRVHHSVCVWMQKYSMLLLSFFLSVTHHGSIVLGFPANHMSGLLMFMPSDINQIWLEVILRTKSVRIKHSAATQRNT